MTVAVGGVGEGAHPTFLKAPKDLSMFNDAGKYVLTSLMRKYRRLALTGAPKTVDEMTGRADPSFCGSAQLRRLLSPYVLNARTTPALSPKRPYVQDVARVQGVTPIPRPTGVHYNTKDVRGKMGLSSEEYYAIKHDVRALTRVAGLNYLDDFRRHDKQKLAWIRREAAARHPVLRDYVDQWPVMLMAGMFLYAARGHARRVGTLPPGLRKRGGVRGGLSDAKAGATARPQAQDSAPGPRAQGLPRKLILRPRVKMRDTLPSLRSAAGLAPATFVQIRADAAKLVETLELDPWINWTKQDKDKMQSFRRQIAEKHPVLEKHEGQWPALAFAKMHIKVIRTRLRDGRVRKMDALPKETDTSSRTLDI
ncbi:uncharacterized protein BXZ73DRAFT_99353 [Epithele typhae]|uniref:uncharacterized protein n=1 Tax=Epithele typhae TaxID=378194 RepID=UPI002008A05F|nr:uncharacterized protein BXZ73DRAFT_99353 [Epithele typhae]KAH9939721.1 hypothetical protein BXZ73DRAFT_99353 [Epithele typhae]